MRLFEYQAKELFAAAGLTTPVGRPATTVEEAVTAAAEVGYPVVLKSQVLTGGRGKAGGIKFADDVEEVRERTAALLAMDIKGEPVERLLIEEKLDIKQEIYLSITMDRAAKKPVLIVSAAGGMDIEELADSNPEAIQKYWINPLTGLYPHHALVLFQQAGFSGTILRQLSGIAVNLYKLFTRYESELVEINPLVLTGDGKLLAADGKMILDANGGGVKLMGAEQEEGMRYVGLDGDIGILANGAGNTMMTMDMVSHMGGEPANFLEVGGELYKRSEEALNYLLSTRSDLNGILVNLFGAYARTDVIVEGIIRGMKANDINIPIVFRVMGTGEERARELVQDYLGISPHTTLDEAARDIVQKAAAYKAKGE
ncbi:MAG: succinate--CoA ligase subunit beta [Firmicutes bacterium]|nr:succinate--CoA ligase subunit beta [Bacillota bacterium]